MTFQNPVQIFRARTMPSFKYIFKENPTKKNISSVVNANSNKKILHFLNIFNVGKKLSSLLEYAMKYSSGNQLNGNNFDNGRGINMHKCCEKRRTLKMIPFMNESEKPKLIIVLIQKFTKPVQIETSKYLSNLTIYKDYPLGLDLPINPCPNYFINLESVIKQVGKLLRSKKIGKTMSTPKNYTKNDKLLKCSGSFVNFKQQCFQNSTDCSKEIKLMRPKKRYDDSKLEWSHKFNDSPPDDKPLRMDDITGYKTKKKLPKLVPSGKCTYSRDFIPTTAPKLNKPKKIYEDSKLESNYEKVTEENDKPPRSDEIRGNNGMKVFKRVHAKNCKLCVRI